MDATKLIEEAGREIAHMKAEALSAANPYNENTIRLTLLIDLTAALKASKEQNKATTISLRCAEANLQAAIAETEPVKSANLAANKRIVELEHESDEWMRRAEGWESEAAIATERFNRLAAAQPGEPLDMDCGDNSCMFATVRGGMRTNGGCRCLESLGFRRGPHDSLRRMAAEIVSLRKRLSDLTTPRPIAEAPTDKPVLGIWTDHGGRRCVEVLRWDGCWRGALGTPLYREAEYLPLPEVKP